MNIKSYNVSNLVRLDNMSLSIVTVQFSVSSKTNNGVIKMATSLHKFQVALKTCEDHPNEELSCFCKTCKKFICTTCAKTTHHGHDWDFIPIVAKKRCKETPVLCRKIKQENMPRCREKLRAVELNISEVEKASDDDLKKLEEKRSAMINAVNQIVDEQKKNRIAIKEKECAKLGEDRSKLRKKMEYLNKMTTNLDINIDAYSDFDVIEMEIDMIKALADLEAYQVGVSNTEVKFVSGEINRAVIAEMIGRIEETTKTNLGDNVNLIEVNSFYRFDRPISSIAPTSPNKAWVADNHTFTIKQLSLQSSETNCVTLPTYDDFISLSNGDFIVTDYDNQVIRRVTSTGKVSDIVSTKPLHPSWISKTQTGDLLVTVRDDGDNYKLQSSSRRLVQRMTLKGKILNTYEFREDGVTRLFTGPYKTTENGNSDICVINRTGDYTRGLVVLHGDGRLRATYRGQEDSKFAFDPSDVACDSKRKSIVSDRKNKALYLLSPDVTFLRYLLTDMFDYPVTMALYKGNLWVGFYHGVVKVYKYTE